MYKTKCDKFKQLAKGNLTIFHNMVNSFISKANNSRSCKTRTKLIVDIFLK